MPRLRIAASLIAALLCAGAANAQTATASKATPNSLTRSEAVSATAVIKSIDPASRKVTLTLQDGEDVSMTAPPEVQNLDRLKAGDRIVATYIRQTEIVISPANAKTPEDAITAVEARAQKGEAPAAGIGGQITVTGAVTAIDRTKNTVKIVSPGGGQVHTVAVVRPEGRERLKTLKVGDRITAHVTEAILLETQPGG